MHTVKHGRWSLNFNADLSGDAELRRAFDGEERYTALSFPAELLRDLIDYIERRNEDHANAAATDWTPRHLPACGTAYRGCAPQCPFDAYQKGEQAGYTKAQDKIRAYMEEEHTP